jgi:hypothetical protein
VHGVLAKQGLHPPVSDLFGVGGRQWLSTAPLDVAYRLRINALLRLIDAIDFEITAVAGPHLPPPRCRKTGYPARSEEYGGLGYDHSASTPCPHARAVPAAGHRRGRLPIPCQVHLFTTGYDCSGGCWRCRIRD